MSLNPALPLLAALCLGALALGRRRGGLAIAVIGLAAAALLAPALRLPDGIPSPAATLAADAPWQGVADPAAGNPMLRDVPLMIQPWLLFVRDELRAGRLPFWNPFQFSGYPCWSAGQAAPLFPLHLLFAAIPLQLGWVLLPWLRLVVAGWGAWALGRELDLSPPAALVGALIFPLSGMVVSFALFPMGNALALVPWVLWAVERLATGRGGAVPVALFAALQLLAGHPETAVHTALLSGLYLAVRGVAKGVRPLAAWGSLAGGWAVGGALAAVQLVPFAANLFETSRWQQWTDAGAAPLAHRLTMPLRLVLPDLFGNPADGSWWGPYDYASTAVYAGAAALPLAAAGVFGVWSAAAGRGGATGSGGAGGAGGARGADAARVDRRWLAVAVLLAFSAAAAYQLPGLREALLAPPLLGRVLHHRLLFGVELGLALLAAAGCDRWLAGRGRGLMAGAAVAAGLLAAAWWRFAGDWAARGLDRRQLAWTGFAAVVALLLVASLRLGLRRRRALLPVLLLAVAGDLVVAHGAVNPGLSLAALYPETGAVRFLRGRPERIAATGTTLAPNTATVYRLYDVRGDDSMKLQRYEAFFADRFGAGHPTYFVPPRVWDSLALDRLGVRWLMTVPGGASPVAAARLAYDGADARVWERPGAPPLVRWTAAAGGPAVPLATAVVIARAPGRWVIDWTAPEPGLLEVAETFDRGWRGRDGGRRVELEPAGGLLLGARLGPGSGRLELTYRPRWLGWGAAGSGLGIAVLGALAWTGRRRRRRREGSRR